MWFRHLLAKSNLQHVLLFTLIALTYLQLLRLTGYVGHIPESLTCRVTSRKGIVRHPKNA